MRKIIEKIGYLFCKIGWHKTPYEYIEYDGYGGCSDKFKCSRCGYVGMVDSQGNLF